MATLADKLREAAACPMWADHAEVSKRLLTTAATLLDERAAEIAAKDALARKLSEALRKVRPLGGSEMFTRVGEEFYADPKYCGDAIDALHQRCREAIKAEIRSERSATAAEARVRALEAFKDAVYGAAGKRPSIGIEEPAWNVDLFEVERRAAIASSPTQEDADVR
jgi:hypothetical protein